MGKNAFGAFYLQCIWWPLVGNSFWAIVITDNTISLVVQGAGLTCTDQVGDVAPSPLEQVTSFPTAQVQHRHLVGARLAHLLQNLTCQSQSVQQQPAANIDQVISSPTNQDTLKPVVEVSHEEDPATAPGGQTHLLQVVVVAGNLQAVLAHLGLLRPSPPPPPLSTLSSSHCKVFHFQQDLPTSWMEAPLHPPAFS